MKINGYGTHLNFSLEAVREVGDSTRLYCIDKNYMYAHIHNSFTYVEIGECGDVVRGTID